MKNNSIQKISLFIAASLLAVACNTVAPKTDKQTETSKTYTMNSAELKTQLDLQDHLEADEDGVEQIYKYSEKDMLIAIPLIAQGLKDSNYELIDQPSFEEKLKTIFGDIFQNENKKVRLREKFSTIFVDKKTDEFDYTNDNLFVSKEHKFITRVPLLGDFIEFTDSTHYKIDLHKKTISLNKYLFNNSKPDLAYLLAEDSLFLKTLVKSFGYTREPKINSLVMNDYLNLDDNHMPTVGEIIFVKNGAGVLEIKQELLQWITNHTTVNDNALALALGQYAYALYSNGDNEMYTNNPFKIFSLEEKRKIAAYIANTYEPLYYNLTPKNSRIWPNSTVLENLLVEDEGLAAYLKDHKYFLLPALKQQLEPAD